MCGGELGLGTGADPTVSDQNNCISRPAGPRDIWSYLQQTADHSSIT